VTNWKKGRVLDQKGRALAEKADQSQLSPRASKASLLVRRISAVQIF